MTGADVDFAKAIEPGSSAVELGNPFVQFPQLCTNPITYGVDMLQTDCSCQ